MSDFNSLDLAKPSRFAWLLSNLSPGKLNTVLTQSSANRGLERYRRAGITASSSFLAKALNIFISFLSVPLTIHYLGSERYGVWLTISGLLTWMTLTDFGLSGNALVNVLAESSGKDDPEIGRHYASSAFWALSGISLVAAVASTPVSSGSQRRQTNGQRGHEPLKIFQRADMPRNRLGSQDLKVDPGAVARFNDKPGEHSDA